MNLNSIDYQIGFLTGYSGGFTSEIKEAFNLLFMYYPTGSIWQHAVAISALKHLN